MNLEYSICLFFLCVAIKTQTVAAQRSLKAYNLVNNKIHYVGGGQNVMRQGRFSNALMKKLHVFKGISTTTTEPPTIFLLYTQPTTSAASTTDETPTAAISFPTITTTSPTAATTSLTTPTNNDPGKGEERAVAVKLPITSGLATSAGTGASGWPTAGESASLRRSAGAVAQRSLVNNYQDLEGTDYNDSNAIHNKEYYLLLKGSENDDDDDDDNKEMENKTISNMSSLKKFDRFLPHESPQPGRLQMRSNNYKLSVPSHAKLHNQRQQRCNCLVKQRQQKRPRQSVVPRHRRRPISPLNYAKLRPQRRQQVHDRQHWQQFDRHSQNQQLIRITA